MMLFRTILNEIVPKQIRNYITVKFVGLFSSYFQTSFTFVIEQKWEFCSNQTYRAAKVYLAMRLAGLDTKELLVGSNDLKSPESELKLGVPVNTKIIDEFEGIHLEWILHSVETKTYPY
ncbi:AAA-ATPase [Cardamine amara subsp. amara]|uniref:AAA-ATPase n=1 Tax=Cardamine amara subsp. amara TaxID=228776 RepID=A0ABD0ZJB2_CARAN